MGVVTNLSTDQSALLALKAHITSDPLNNLKNNWSTTTTASAVCHWIGVICTTRHHRVAALVLSHMGLTGTIPPHIGNLSFLVQLDIYNNSFYGYLPQEMTRLRRLKHIAAGDNNFGGPIPSWLGEISQLEFLDFGNNSFTGEIPREMGNLNRLELLDLSKAGLSGHIPSSIFNVSSLIFLALPENKFVGVIPDEIGELPKINVLILNFNHLSGSVPTTLFNSSTIQRISIVSNRLTGNLPSGQYLSLPNLKRLLLGINTLTGTIPSIITNASQLTELDLVDNKFSGSISNSIASLTLLKFLNLGNNLFSKESSSPELEFITSLTNCKYLTELLINDNPLNGILPISIGNLSGSLERFAAGNSRIMGNIPHEIGNLSNLISLVLSGNSLTGFIPESLERLQKLQLLDVACALEYLHHGYSTPVLHLDLKPSNVLLDEDMVARVSDFGIAKFLGDDENAAHTKTLATLGYMAPEYGSEGLASTKCDVYSFGIMLMETFTRTSPTDAKFIGDFSLKRWVEESLPNNIIQVADTNLLRPEEEDYSVKVQCVSSIMELALNCSTVSPEERINMKDVLASLKKIRHTFLTNCGEI
ncbi:cysteine-rich RLK (RECEPTOR-like protein kinase) 37 [Actinidia rufa]|uniref:non-specific serine/threonine protein kinase n=1 Tax=Actinidia rufa TaxID=165716 RepID=A0A7J0H8W0_9ERIC|nr:cysteine-rich RLK (RECEPTOR-like protein kinase) 37 [Actinidia rufa]